MKIDLNADIGEGFGPWGFGEDEALLQTISSANIACGYHAGDAEIMDRTVATAVARGIGIGAHVGFPDMMSFGRRNIQFDPHSFSRHVVYQLGALAGFAHLHGGRVRHMNFHGALGHMIALDERLAEVMVAAIAEYDPGMGFSTIPDGETMRAARRHGMPAVGSFFADRAYGPDGRLVGRNQPGAVIADSERVAARVMRLLDDGTVETTDGRSLAINARSVLVHSDTPGAAAHARAIRTAVEAAGGTIVPVAELFAEAG
ncbi:MAG: LamB/YcsF family protein [Alphaproteobacteria bacterium]